MPRRKVLIPRNSPLPAQGSGRFVTRADGQSDVAVKVIEGGDASGNHATPIGRFLVENLPPGTKKGTPVVVQFTYQQDGRLDVSASVGGVEGSGTMSVERATGLSEAELEMWQGRIGRNQVVQQPEAEAAPETAPAPEPAAAAPEPQTPAAAPPDPAAAMAAATLEPVAAEPVPAPAEPVDDEPFDFDALLDSEEDDLLGEDPEALPEPVAEAPAEPQATEVQAAAPTEKIEIPEPAEEPAFDGPLFVEQPVVEQPVVEPAPVAETPAPTPAPVETAQETPVEQPADPAPAVQVGDPEQAPAETEAPVFGEAAEKSDAPTAEQLGIEDNNKEVALGSLDFLQQEEETKKAEDDNDLQDFLSNLQ